ncbi:response regulator transcription factor [Patulibacter minatonensis]|uniref:response regulator transcription factor n=1 Tax=Patulibacter minatonensis TaxID=298163 RepID=UPI000479EB80|nr:LuxR C-terminal-related transcriptional regulator [Patulibacter minatonensis]
MLHASTGPAATIAGDRRPDATPQVTTRELTVLSLVVEGFTNPQIARRLNNSPRTVQSHVQSLMRKFRVETRTQLAVGALRGGFVPLHPIDVAPDALLTTVR